MKKIQTHLQNLYLLIEEAGSLGELARRSGYDNPSALYQLKHRLEKQAQDETIKGRGIQSALQAKLENGMGKPAGWMGRKHLSKEEKAEKAEKTAAEAALAMAAEAAQARSATVSRHTSETQITVSINLDGTGQGRFDTGVPFLEHMLDQISRHSLIDLDITCRGDSAHRRSPHRGRHRHHAGQALKQALGDKAGICRYGMSDVPLDEALSRVVLRLSGRPGLAYNLEFTRAMIGKFDVDLFSEFFHGLVNHSMMTLHIDNLRGINAHHQAETVFKAFGRALRMAVAHDERMAGQMPSTKARSPLDAARCLFRPSESAGFQTA